MVAASAHVLYVRGEPLSFQGYVTRVAREKAVEGGEGKANLARANALLWRCGEVLRQAKKATAAVEAQGEGFYPHLERAIRAVVRLADSICEAYPPRGERGYVSPVPLMPRIPAPPQIVLDVERALEQLGGFSLDTSAVDVLDEKRFSVEAVKAFRDRLERAAAWLGDMLELGGGDDALERGLRIALGEPADGEARRGTTVVVAGGLAEPLSLAEVTVGADGPAGTVKRAAKVAEGKFRETLELPSPGAYVVWAQATYEGAVGPRAERRVRLVAEGDPLPPPLLTEEAARALVVEHYGAAHGGKREVLHVRTLRVEALGEARARASVGLDWREAGGSGRPRGGSDTRTFDLEASEGAWRVTGMSEPERPAGTPPAPATPSPAPPPPPAQVALPTDAAAGTLVLTWFATLGPERTVRRITALARVHVERTGPATATANVIYDWQRIDRPNRRGRDERAFPLVHRDGAWAVERMGGNGSARFPPAPGGGR
jgi:hypothetical protein